MIKLAATSPELINFVLIGVIVTFIGSLATSAFFSDIISDLGYQLTIIVISLTLLISPFWVAGTKKLMN